MAESDLNPRELTWAALLGRWLEVARAAVAFPDDEEGQRWRESVPAIINLQAVTMALGELTDLERQERELGVDKAELLIRESCGELNRHWRGLVFPGNLNELTDDAFEALERAAALADVLVCEAEAMAPAWGEALAALGEAGFGGTLYVAREGARLAAGAPLAWAQRGDLAPLLEVVKRALLGASVLTGRACQVYRQADDAGQPAEDVAVALESPPIAGLPLLVLAIERGERVGAVRMQSFGAVPAQVLGAVVPFRIDFESPSAD
jgi:hypothetical protein